jgi:ABC-2 type transport system permease protein
MRFCMMLNPLTYGVEALRGALFPDASKVFSLPVNLAVTAGVCVLTFAASWAIVNRRTHRPAA